MSVLRFDGIKKGGITHLKLNFLIFKQEWISYNTHSASSTKGFYFIDKGKKLPFPLKRWKHRHIVFGKNSSCIIDRVMYSTGIKLIDLALFPAMWLMFYARKPSYKSYYRK
ncbi:hypothetical protein OO013_12770 [Mangrovivirga sp. M17]|uniref:Uncharacterized protein n=1 Tax=Mangrovivirga halotolerans TaxID=2993936 RepID=A0ABT3RTR3_9BACT|nr:hypothetical protein [Mangrovivirga halotolerans]MCX2744748.1 hypothetical protein [Mangrovivirga halotolerans]